MTGEEIRGGVPSRGTKIKERLFCLDLMRGLDIFYLTVILPFFGWRLGSEYLPQWLADQLNHVLTAFTDGGPGAPTGITFTDFAQPGFVFITGVATVFSIPRRLDANGRPTRAYWLHLLGRLALLWSLGCIIRNACTLDPAKFTPYSDTLQTIAVAYCGAALSFLIPSIKVRLALPLLLLLGYGIVQATFGDYTRLGNISRIIDERLFGMIGCRGKDFCYILTTVAWMSMGMMASLIGGIVKSAREPWSRAKALALWGLASTALGWILAIWIPQNRYIYTVSFVFTTFGYATLLLDALFVVTDIWKCRRGVGLFIIFGQSSLVAWMLHTNPIRHGLKAVAAKCVEGLPRLGVSANATDICAEALVSVFVVSIVVAWYRRKGKA